MMLVDEGCLHDNTIVRIGEEMGIFRHSDESKVEYVMRVIAELSFVYPKDTSGYPKNELKK